MTINVSPFPTRRRYELSLAFNSPIATLVITIFSHIWSLFTSGTYPGTEFIVPIEIAHPGSPSSSMTTPRSFNPMNLVGLLQDGHEESVDFEKMPVERDELGASLEDVSGDPDVVDGNRAALRG